MRNEIVILIGLILLIVLLIIGGPIATILALNTLFNLGIPVTFWTWLSTFWLCVVFGTGKLQKNKD